jgi:hypothetical protein
LGDAFGADHVFIDVQDIAPGDDFVQTIEKTVSGCDVLIAVIGPRWLDLLRSRTGDHDFVEQEIAAALRRGIKVVPVLVGGASMPAARDLPENLAGLARRQAISISDADFDRGVSGLVDGIGRSAGRKPTPKRLLWIVVAAGIVIALAGSIFLLLGSRERASLNGTWIARMQRPGQRPYSIRIRFETSGRTLTGQVDYPTGSGAIQGGTLDDDRVAFFTKHVPQFESEPATIVFSGQIRGTEIDLTATTPDGNETKGVARKSN